jgi:putative oxidoreductase
MHALYPDDSSWIDTAGRLLIVAFFVIAWLRNLLTDNVEDHIKRLALFKCPMPRQAFWVGMTLNAIGSALILINWHAAVGVLVLIIFTVLATLLLLRFWEMNDPIKRSAVQTGFLANLGILGGLLLLLQNVM